jgi:glycosyltransferase involved in cell wall biosynthesis
VPVSHARYGAYITRQAYGPEFFSNVHAFNNACGEEITKRHRVHRYDVIHHHDWLTAFAAMKAKYALGIPMVSTFHSTEFDRCSTGQNDYILGIEKQAMAVADRIITVSKYMKKQLVERFGVWEGKIRVIYNAVDPSDFARHWEVQHGKKRIVLFLGRLTEQKAPAQFLYAAKRVLEKEKNVQFVIAGVGDMLGYLINLAISLGISEHVTFIGYLPEEQKRYVYAKSDVYVMPSISEPFGITALEAMVSGTPVILSKTSGAAEITPHVLTVDFWDINGLAEKIIALLRYKVLSKTLSKAEFEDAIRMTWDKVADETIRVYKEVAGREA